MAKKVDDLKKERKKETNTAYFPPKHSGKVEKKLNEKRH